MNTRKSKKGFTIVELVIVIAVIAILAAVLIPTFANLIRQANKSSDTQLVKNMNTILSAAEALNGKNETMADALQDILDAGYSVEKLTPTTEKCHIVWNQKTDRMIFLDENFEVEYPKDEKIDDTNDIWMVVGDKAALDAYQANYSIYLTEDFKEETVKVAHGLDVGSCKTIKTVECVNESYAGTILINMAGGNLTVNAPKATVNHYGDAALVEIEAVANASYHENGNVDEIRLKAGRVVVESKGNVAGVRIVADAISDGENGKKNVSVEVAAGGKLGAVGATNSTVAADLKNIVSGSTDVIESPVEVTNDFAGGFGTENSPYLIATAEQFANIAKLSEEMGAGKAKYFKQVADIAINGTIPVLTGTYDGGNYKIMYDCSGKNFGVVFTEIKGYSVFKNINLVMGKVGVSLLSIADWGTSYGATFDHITFESTEDLVKVNTNNFGFVMINAIYTGGEGAPVYTFSNITNNVNLQNDGTCTGLIVGSGPCFNVKTVLNYENCVNNGTISGTSSVGFLYGNSAYIETVSESESVINVKDCKNNGLFMALKDSANVAFAPKLADLNDKYQGTAGGTFLSENYLSNKNFTVNQNGTVFSINTTYTNVSYKLVFDVSAIYSKKDGKAWTDADTVVAKDKEKWDTIWNVSNGTKYPIDLSVDIDATGELSGSFKAYDKKTAAANGISATNFTDGYALVVKDGVTYLVFDVTEDVYIDCAVKLSVYAYDANGNLKGIKGIK